MADASHNDKLKLFYGGLAKAELLIRDVAARELADDAVYLVSTGEKRELLGGSALAWTTSRLDERLQPLLKECGRWRGPGFAAIFAVEYFTAKPADRLVNRILAIALHELAHWLTFRWALEEVAPAAFRDSAADELRAPTRDECQPPSWPPWWLHGSSWIRLALHLVARANWHTVDVWPSEACIAGGIYGLSSDYCYSMALGSEPLRMRHATLDEILAEPEPAEFRQLFEADVAKYHDWLEGTKKTPRGPVREPVQ